MAGVEERLTLAEEKIEYLEAMLDATVLIIQESLARKNRKFGLTECEAEQYEKINDHIKNKEEKKICQT